MAKPQKLKKYSLSSLPEPIGSQISVGGSRVVRSLDGEWTPIAEVGVSVRVVDDTAPPTITVESVTHSRNSPGTARFFVKVADAQGVDESTLIAANFNVFRSQPALIKQVSIENLNIANPNVMTLEVVWDYSSEDTSINGDWTLRSINIGDLSGNKTPIQLLRTIAVQIQESGGTAPTGDRRSYEWPESMVWDVRQVHNIQSNDYGGLVPNDPSKATSNTQKLLAMYIAPGPFGSQETMEDPTPIMSGAALYFPDISPDQSGTNYYFDGFIGLLKGVTWYGDGSDRSRLVLKANSPGYEDGDVPKRFIEMGYIQGDFGGFGFKHFHRGYRIVIEPGNPGAVALSHYISNNGSVNDVVIEDLGNTAYCGIACRGGGGPSLMHEIEIIGFKYSIWPGGSPTFDRVTFKYPRVAAIYNFRLNIPNQPDTPGGKPYTWGGGTGGGGVHSFVEGATILLKGSARATYTEPGHLAAQITNFKLIDSTIIHEDGISGSAIPNCEGFYYLRNITYQGFDSLIEVVSPNPNPRIVGAGSTYLDEFFTHDESPTGLPRMTPMVWEEPPSSIIFPEPPPGITTADMFEFGASTEDKEDDTAAVQAAIDTGAEYIYPSRSSPIKSIQIRDTLYIRGDRGGKTTYFTTNFVSFGNTVGSLEGKPMMVIENTGGPVVLFNIGWGGVQGRQDAVFVHNSPHPLILFSVQVGGSFGVDSHKYCYRSEISNPGDVWAYDIGGRGQWLFNKGNTFRCSYANINIPNDYNHYLVNSLHLDNGSRAHIKDWRQENSTKQDVTDGIVTVDGGSTLQLDGLYNDLKEYSDNGFITLRNGQVHLCALSFPAVAGSAYPTNYANWEEFIQVYRQDGSKRGPYKLYNMQSSGARRGPAGKQYLCVRFNLDNRY